MRYGFWPVAAAVILLLVGGSLLLTKVLDLIHDNKATIARSQEAITKNRDLGCRVGAFLVGIPIVKQPGTSQRTFEHQVVAAEDFLHALKALDCRGLGQVTTGAINKQLRALHEIVPEGGGGSTGNPHRPGSPTGGGPEPAPPRPSTTTAPAPSTTTTTTTTTTTAPPPTEPPPILRRVCRLDPILGRVCRLIPVTFLVP